MAKRDLVEKLLDENWMKFQGGRLTSVLVRRPRKKTIRVFTGSVDPAAIAALAAAASVPTKFLRSTPTGAVCRATPSNKKAPKSLVGNGTPPGELFTGPGPITTRGATSSYVDDAYVYVAELRGGKIKIGITARLEERMIGLRGKLVFSVAVVRDAAREIETEALRILRNSRGDGEVVRMFRTQIEAADAVKRAYAVVGGYRHVDPSITEDEARRARIAKVVIGA
jgi:hypothetical protein